MLSEYKGLFKINKEEQEQAINQMVKKGEQNIRDRVKENKFKSEVDNNLLIV